jgi:hypothetical protein
MASTEDKRFFVVTIDTEIDKSADWMVPPDESFHSVLEGIPARLSPLFDGFGTKPTYLLSSEVIENDDCVSTLKGLRDCELGTHLHGDLIEPQRTIYELRNRSTAAMQCSYSKEIEREKLANLTDLFIRKFGHRPTSFRAGRFGAGKNTVGLLEELGYMVDSSVTPCVDWDFPEGRADFMHVRDQPYFPGRADIVDAGDSRILEVPVSIVCPRIRRYLHYSGNVRLLRHMNKFVESMFPAVWLRPSVHSTEEMLRVARSMERRKSPVVLNMMFHSMEVIPNASPYTKTEKECVAYLKRVEDILRYCRKNGFVFATLSELYPHYREDKHV